MLTQALVLAGVVVLFGAWLWTSRGRESLRLFTRARILWLLPLALCGVTWVADEADLGVLDEVVIDLPEHGLLVTPASLLLLAAHLAASTLAVAGLARRHGAPGVRALALAPGVALAHVLVWVPLWGIVRVARGAGLLASSAGMLVSIALAVSVVALGVLVGRFVGRLPATGARIGPALARCWRRDVARESRVLAPVLLRLLLTGALVVVWIHEAPISPHGTGRLSAFHVGADVQSVAAITTTNPWPHVVALALLGEPPVAIARGFDLLGAYASLLFLAAFVSGVRAPSAPPRAPSAP